MIYQVLVLNMKWWSSAKDSEKSAKINNNLDEKVLSDYFNSSASSSEWEKQKSCLTCGITP